MDKLVLENSEKTKRIISKKNYPYLVEFNTPEHLREQLPYLELEKIHGSFLMDGFYSDPMIGDIITYRGYEWRIIGRKYPVRRFTEEGKKRVPTLIVEYLGQATDNDLPAIEESDPINRKEFILSLIPDTGDRLTARELYRNPVARSLGINTPDVATEVLRTIAHELDGELSYQEKANRFGSISRYITRLSGVSQ